MEDKERKKTCCFFGHRKINETEELRDRMFKTIEQLITENGVDTFLFGSKSKFDDFAHEVVTKLQEIHPHIKRIYVRAEFAYISESYRNSLLEHYEDTYYPEHMIDAGKASYVERNQEMIKKSYYCICYYDANYLPPRRKNSRRDLSDYQPKSGTKVAYDFAVKKCGQVINVFEA